MTPSSSASSTRRSEALPGYPPPSGRVRSPPAGSPGSIRHRLPAAAPAAARAQSGAFCGCSAAHSAHSRSTVRNPYRPKSCRRWISPGCAEAFSRTRIGPFHRPPYCLRQQVPPADGPRRNFCTRPSLPFPRTNTAVSSMQALEQRSPLEHPAGGAFAQSCGTRRPAHRQVFLPPPGGIHHLLCGFKRRRGQPGSTTASSGFQITPGCGAASSFASSSLNALGRDAVKWGANCRAARAVAVQHESQNCLRQSGTSAGCSAAHPNGRFLRAHRHRSNRLQICRRQRGRPDPLGFGQAMALMLKSAERVLSAVRGTNALRPGDGHR